ncbi:hypothetical protein DV736_g1395, partial [Chaetothyriales sp. CBS 134916]
MRAAWRVRPRSLGEAQSFSVRSPFRNASLTGAISRGIREGQKSAENRRGTYEDLTNHARRQWSSPMDHERGFPERARRPHQRRGHLGYLTDAPRTTPYTAADSEFLYGLHSIEAAIRARRRKLYKLYVYASEDGGVRSDAEKGLYRQAANAKIEIVRVGGPEWKQKLSQLAGGRAHNGFILEASPIPILTLHSLGSVEYAGAPWQAQLSEGATSSTSLLPKAENRFPLLLLLDAVTDTGNIGAILRSAYFFGLDGIIVPEFGSTSTANMLKASSGAAEFMPIFRIRNEVEFLESSLDSGWHISTAVAPDAQVRVTGSRRPQSAGSRQTSERILESQPTILILGNEGTGVRQKLMKLSDSFMSIQDAQGIHEGVDSLNVSAAAAILMRDLVKPFLVLRNRDKVQSQTTYADDEDLF